MEKTANCLLLGVDVLLLVGIHHRTKQYYLLRSCDLAVAMAIGGQQHIMQICYTTKADGAK